GSHSGEPLLAIGLVECSQIAVALRVGQDGVEPGQRLVGPHQGDLVWCDGNAQPLGGGFHVTALAGLIDQPLGVRLLYPPGGFVAGWIWYSDDAAFRRQHDRDRTEGGQITADSGGNGGDRHCERSKGRTGLERWLLNFRAPGFPFQARRYFFDLRWPGPLSVTFFSPCLPPLRLFHRRPRVPVPPSGAERHDSL